MSYLLVPWPIPGWLPTTCLQKPCLHLLWKVGHGCSQIQPGEHISHRGCSGLLQDPFTHLLGWPVQRFVQVSPGRHLTQSACCLQAPHLHLLASPRQGFSHV